MKVSNTCIVSTQNAKAFTRKATDDSNSGITEIRTEYKRLVLNFNAFHF